ncbi:glycosyltransferase family protein [Streptomyces acidiscabies]|uniref:glycosyltransferase family protein n=1 Tax=Streptomyces acidiscabies TaxID=42234 RepID=UPI000951ADC5|nr:hypothetical protein [Streptomyces acidiscabies]
MGHQVRIGYSFWGFFGAGITDTPDGGRSHRRPLVDALRGRGHDVVFLQADRDLLEAGDDLGGAYTFDSGFPEIDVLFLEWRWRIARRNTTPCGSPGHTCDLHRQHDLIRQYALRHTPTVIWDKDRKLGPRSPWRRTPGAVVCEASLALSKGAHRLLFPVDDRLLDAADPAALARQHRAFPLGYVGNQYDRNDAFDRYFAPAAAHVEHRVGGKWTTRDRWPHVDFLGRIPFPEVHPFYSGTLATVLLLPQRYATVGQMTQRIFEAVLAGCLPLAPADILSADQFVPDELVVHSGTQVVERIRSLQKIAGTPEHARLIATCLDRLDVFRLSRQVEALEDVLNRVTRGGGV